MGKTTPRTRPLKKPSQERSQATVDVILEAAARVFVKQGYARATTNRIAEAAGVSVGSLYQYFPSKDAIAVELIRRYRERLLRLVSERFAKMDEVTFESSVHALLEAVLRSDGIDPTLHRVLIERVLRTSARAEVADFEEKLEQLIAMSLRAAGNRVRAADLDVAAFVLVRVVLAGVHASVVDRQGYDPRLCDELTRLVVRYLEP